MLRVSDSKNWPFAKAVGALLRPSLHHPAEGEEERIWVCGGKTSDLCKNSPGVHPLLENDHGKPILLYTTGSDVKLSPLHPREISKHSHIGLKVFIPSDEDITGSTMLTTGVVS